MAVYTLEEYAKLKKKKKKNEDAVTLEGNEKSGLKNVITLEENARLKGIDLMDFKHNNIDIAPVMTTSKKEEEAGKLDFFQKGAFTDGYQFGDVTKTILGTVGDAGVGIVKGGASLVEGITDATRYGVAGISDAFGNETYADKVRKKAQNNAVENIFKSTDDYLDQYSVLGRTSDAILQGVGQVGGLIGAGAVAGALGVGVAGATALTSGIMGLSSTGSGMSEAYEGGATDEEATKYGISKGIIDAGTELLFGGLGKTINAVGLSKGISSIDDLFAQKLSSKLSNQVAKNFVEFGVKASAEGFEEVLAGLGSAVAKKLTYMDEEELSKIIEDENLLEQFVVGTVTSGMIQSGYIPKTAEGSLKQANETGRDFITGYTQNEQAVIDKEVEKRVGDRKLSKKELGEIEEQVKKDLEKGYIDIDTIESALGGETYNQYKSITEQEEALTKQLEELKKAPNTVGNAKLYEETENKLAELKKNSNKTQIKEQLSKEVQELTKSDLIIESYNEKGRRSQKFEADLTKYDEKQQAVIKKAVESGILNNTNRTHEFVDMVARLSADKGVSFDFTNNTKLKESGFAIEGKTVNGYIKDGNIAVNIDSNKALNTVVGHEITHVLEGTELYTELQNVIKAYATTKGEYDTRYNALKELYKDVDGAVIENEVTADLVGEYLFTDSDFINNLSTTKPNVFKKIYDEIKYLYKLATAGSKEARELEKVKRAFDKAYKENVVAKKGEKYSFAGERARTSDKSQLERALDMKLDGATSEEIRQATGWHKGYDGEWRYEIDDSQMDIIDTENNYVKLDKLLKHDKLFEAYPMLKKIDVSFKDLEGDLNGSFNSRNFDIELNAKLKNDSEQLKSTLIHEVQHAIQGLESFASGSNIKYWEQRLDGTYDSRPQNVKVKEKELQEMYSSLLENEPEFVSEMKKLEDMTPTVDRGAIDWDTFEQIEEDPIEWQEFDAERDRLTEKYGMDKVFDFMDMRHEMNELKTKGIRTARELYFDTAGEIEARETEKRLSYNEAERKKYQPTNKLENIKRDNVVFTRGNNQYSLSADTEGKSLTREQQEYFKDSKVVDENGNLKVMYHGTGNGGFHEFVIADDGQSFFFTDDNTVAKSYSGTRETYAPRRFNTAQDVNDFFKEINTTDYEVAEENGKFILYDEGENVAESDTADGIYDEFRDWTGLGYGSSNYKVYLNLKNPLIVDAKGNQWDELSLTEFTGVESDTFDNTRDFSKYAKENGYDGVIFKNLYDNGVYASSRERVASTVAIAFDSNQIKSVANTNPTTDADIRYSMGDREVAPTGNYRVYGKDIALETPENITEMPENSEKISETATKNTVFEDYAPLTEEEANERDAMMGDRLYDVNDLYMPEEAEAPYYEETAETTEAVSPFEEKDIQDVGNRKQKAYMYENPEVKPYFQAEANVMLGELRNSVKGEKHFNDQLYYDSNGEQGWYGTKRETSEQIAYMLDKFKYTYADIEKGLRAIIEDHGAENNAVSKRLEFMIDERLREGYTDFASGYEIPSNQEYINLLNEKQITEYSDEAYNRYLESLAYAEAPADHFLDNTEMVEAPVDEVQVLYSLEAQQQEKIAELDSTVEAEDSIEATELPTVESVDAKLENYKTALEGYKTARATIETSFDDVINKKTAEYNALKRKDTQRATTLLMQIENMKLRKSNNIATLDNKISKVESTIDKMSNGIPTKRQIYHRNIVDNIKSVFNSKGFDFDKVLEKAKNKGTFSSVDNTPQRFIEKSLGYKEGQILNDLTVNKVAQNESKGIQWLNSFTDKRSGLLAQISKEYGIKPRSKESASAQMYAEGFWVDDDGNFIKYGDEELAKDFPNAKVRENIKKLAKDERVRKIYDDTLKMINESRKRNLYPEIPRRKNYFLHFREMEDTFSKLGIPFNPNDIKLKDLPTDINGVTADLKPGQPYFASAKQRIGYKTTYDLVGGVERYLNSAKNQIYHIDDIQTLRALRNYIADTYGQAKGLESLDSMTEEEAVARIEEVYNSHLSTFAKFLNEEANILAGKTSLTDRGLEGVIGRRGIQFLDTVNRQVGSNMVGANISSALTNTVSMVQSIAKSNKFDSTKAFAQTVSNQLGSIIGKTDGFVENNPMMIRRKGIEKLQTKFFDNIWGNVTDKGYLLMSAIDNISSEFIVRTKFNELTRKGMSEQQAHIEADKWASRILGDRSLGQQPQLYNSKMLGLVTKFQLEVRNQLDSQFYDTIQEAKVSNEEIENRLVRNMKTSAKIGSTFFQLAVLQHLFGQAFESVAGYNPAFDIVEALSQMLGFDDDEESEDTVLDNIEEGFLTLLGDLPYTSTFTGGRIPISSALPVKQFITGKDSYGNEKSRWETIKETAPYYLAPTGYGQWKKTKAGLEMFNEEHPIAGSYTKSGTLRFPVEDTPLNRLQAGIFGQYASENARDYFDNERKPLNARQIEEYSELDIPIRDYWEYLEGRKGLNTNAEKTDYINSLDLPISKKNILINNVLDRKEDVDMTGYEDLSGYEEFDFATKNPEKYAISKAVGGYESYVSYTDELKNIEGVKDENGKTIRGSVKENKKNYIFSLDIDDGQKYILYRSEFDSQDDKDEYNEKIVNYLNGRSDISYEDMVTILESLDMQILSDGTVIW